MVNLNCEVQNQAQRSRVKLKITLEIMLGKLPIAQIEGTIHKHIQPLTKMLPDKRMGSVIEVIILVHLGANDK